MTRDPMTRSHDDPVAGAALASSWYRRADFSRREDLMKLSYMLAALAVPVLTAQAPQITRIEFSDDRPD